MARKGSRSPKRIGSRAEEEPSSKRLKTSLVALPFNDYAPTATFMDDIRTISSMWFGKIDGDTHQDMLESFYKNQAELYDGYRARMLHARKPMMTRLMVDRERKGDVVWVDLGGGTGGVFTCMCTCSCAALLAFRSARMCADTYMVGSDTEPVHICSLEI
jgi:hypothetical protein